MHHTKGNSQLTVRIASHLKFFAEQNVLSCFRENSKLENQFIEKKRKEKGKILNEKLLYL